MVVLGIDPAATSGVALLHGSVLLWTQSVHAFDRALRDSVVQAALTHARESGVRLLVGAERFGGTRGRASFATAFGVGAAWGAWYDSLRAAGVAAGRILLARPQVWRGAVLGKGNAGKSAAVAYVKARFGVKVSDDEAEAACVALWRAAC